VNTPACRPCLLWLRGGGATADSAELYSACLVLIVSGYGKVDGGRGIGSGFSVGVASWLKDNIIAWAWLRGNIFLGAG
jgi:hypothetical protein